MSQANSAVDMAPFTSLATPTSTGAHVDDDDGAEWVPFRVMSPDPDSVIIIPWNPNRRPRAIGGPGIRVRSTVAALR
ncbi:hypothetical protein Z517_09367 [Fonsecaea pedrosoi CBS 271.37]|uniref:Uncharacterized protein n=1 Tax=Fonsecaea pedrosoi CBS 271.37 TaxID=1442368 RepID=A0A0D2G8B7_9EURO|nr:uncharacterized protein Z517_09367 [Fonsecaea pedrosoi CBS 271.37]KIW76923.1 hypothetical protein Z517_09367 [Fonsecaea pedrosoi CBS 271.37]